MSSKIIAGTTSGTALNMSADTSGQLEIQTGATPTTAITVTSAQNVGIGTTSPSQLLELSSASNPCVMMTDTTNTVKSYMFAGNLAAYMGSATNHPTVFQVNDSEKMRIDTSGNVGINTSSPRNVGGYTSLALNNTTGTLIDTFVNGTRSGGIATTSVSMSIGSITAMPVVFNTSDAERMRIDSSGNVLLGRTTAPSFGSVKLAVQNDTGTFTTAFLNNAGTVLQLWGTGSASTGWNAGDATSYVAKNTSTNRSVNAAGTLNANGADYAEYMVKSGDFTVAKGDVIGIDANGKLTNVFAESISFVVKSTDPSFVGGDSWGIDLDEEALESARKTVDRIAFAGQVPVNVLGATAGQYIIPVNDNGSIKGEAVSNPTFEQYQNAVGKVIAIEDDGRARIIVKAA